MDILKNVIVRLTFLLVLGIIVLFTLGFSESFAYKVTSTAPTIHDADHDGLSESVEQELGSDPYDYDTDDDGYGDGEEYYDLGTSPVEVTQEIITSEEVDQGVYTKIFSVDDNSILQGTSLYLRGVHYKEDTDVAFAIINEEQGRVLEFKTDTDDRGVFSKVLPLHELCGEEGMRQTLHMHSNYQRLLTLYLDCREVQHDGFLSHATFGEKSIVLAQPEYSHFFYDLPSIVFTAELEKGMELEVSYNSIVLSSTFLSDLKKHFIRSAPFLPLSTGDHNLILQFKDPTKNTVYSPVVIPFSLKYSGSFIQASVYYIPTAMIAIVVIVGTGIIAIRRIRRKEGLELGE